MSNFTTQIRYIIESVTQGVEYTNLNDRIEKACPLIFNFDYPIWNEEYKTTLEKKILLRYFNKEIGLETYGLWKVYLQEKFNSIMPYYVELYNATVPGLDITKDTIINTIVNSTKNTDMTGTEGVNTTGSVNTDIADNKNQTINGTNNTVTLNNDFPQSPHNNTTTDYTINSQNVDNTVANTTINTDTQSVDSSNSEVVNRTNNVDSEEVNTMSSTVTGSLAADKILDNIKKKRDLINNIDKMIVDELVDLFILLY